jgi:hypothetical protein
MREQKAAEGPHLVTVLRQLNYLEWRFLALKYRPILIRLFEFCHREPQYDVCSSTAGLL